MLLTRLLSSKEFIVIDCTYEIVSSKKKFFFFFLK